MGAEELSCEKTRIARCSWKGREHSLWEKLTGWGWMGELAYQSQRPYCS